MVSVYNIAGYLSLLLTYLFLILVVFCVVHEEYLLGFFVSIFTAVTYILSKVCFDVRDHYKTISQE